jgi:hypothetical protein
MMTPGTSPPALPAPAHRPGAAASRELTREAFDALLELLDSDRDQAARHYEAIRSKLIRLFAWRGWAAPEELADVTLDRVARKLQAGLRIEADDPYRYISAVAYRVFKEKVRESERRRKQHDEYRMHAERELAAQDDEEEDILLACLKECLGQIASDDRELILRYYEKEKRARINNRKALARELGMEMNNLRLRAHRIRQRLERCTHRCASGN